MADEVKKEKKTKEESKKDAKKEVKKEVKTEAKKETKKDVKKAKKGLIIGIIAAAVVLVALVIGALVAYNKGVLKSILGNNLKEVIGEYELIEMEDNGNTTTKEDLEALKKLGLHVTLEAREDKTGTISLFGENMEFTYNKKEFNTDEGTVPYTFEDDKISMEKDGSRLVFQKVVDLEENDE